VGDVAVGDTARMEPDRARQLLANERERIEQSIANLGGHDPDGEGERTEPGDEASEALYQDEFDAGRAEDFKEQLAALERAEERLAAGTYGLSIVSGEPIPDARLEVVPTAERTVEEEAAG
jgi:DnaK suppressor protein